MKKIMTQTALLVFAAVMTGCTPKTDVSAEQASTKIDQTNLCEVKEWKYNLVAEACTPGQKVVYLPASYGSEQLPIIFAAVNCDLRFSVSLTNGGVTCIYGPITPKAS